MSSQHNWSYWFTYCGVGLVSRLPTRLVFGSFYNINTTLLLLMSTEDMSYWVSKFLEDCSLQIDNMVTKSCRERCEELGYKCGIGPVLVLHAITSAATWSICIWQCIWVLITLNNSKWWCMSSYCWEREISPRKNLEPSWESIEPEAEVVDMWEYPLCMYS